MTKKGMRALRRSGHAQGWSEFRIWQEIKRVDDAVDLFMANDPNVGERDRFWLEAVVRAAVYAPECVRPLMAINYPGRFPGSPVFSNPLSRWTTSKDEHSSNEEVPSGNR